MVSFLLIATKVKADLAIKGNWNSNSRAAFSKTIKRCPEIIEELKRIYDDSSINDVERYKMSKTIAENAEKEYEWQLGPTESLLKPYFTEKGWKGEKNPEGDIFRAIWRSISRILILGSGQKEKNSLDGLTLTSLNGDRGSEMLRWYVSSVQAVVSTDPSVVCPKFCSLLGININIIKGISEPRGLFASTWRVSTTDEEYTVEHHECTCEKALYKEESPFMGVTLRMYRQDNNSSHFESVVPKANGAEKTNGVEGAKLNVIGTGKVVETALLKIYTEWRKISPLVEVDVSAPSRAVPFVGPSKELSSAESLTTNSEKRDDSDDGNAAKEHTDTIGSLERVHNCLFFPNNKNTNYN
jgi:hypothetical protein